MSAGGSMTDFNSNQKSSQSNKSRWDRIGIFLSSLCVVHCLLLPILMVVSPATAIFFKSEENYVHTYLLLFLIPVAFFALYSGFRMHKEKKPIFLMIVGVAFVLAGTFLAHKWLGHVWEPVVVTIGSVIIVRAHLLNSHHCRKCEEEHHCIWDHESEEQH